MVELEDVFDEDCPEGCDCGCEEAEWLWEPSCAMDCELCGCHGDCPDCGTEDDEWDEDYEDPDEDYSEEGIDTEK